MHEVTVQIANGEEVSGIIDDVESGQLLVFPAGRFTWTEPVKVAETFDWGIRCQPDTVFEVPEGWGDGEKRYLLDARESDNFLLEQLTVDAPGRAAPGVRVATSGRAQVNGLHYRCDGPTSIRKHTIGLNAFATRPSGLVRVDNYRQFNNGDIGGYGGGDTRIGVWVGAANEGTVHLVNPVLQGFPNNACYVSRQPGQVIIQDGFLVNNNVSAVRVSDGVEVHDTTIGLSLDGYLGGDGVFRGGKHNTRGFWGDVNNESADSGGLISGCSVILQDYHNATAMVLPGDNPDMTVRDTQFFLGATIDAVHALRVAGPVEITDCTFDGPEVGCTAGVGDIVGWRNDVAKSIDHGDVTVESRSAEFDWDRVHPLTVEWLLPGLDRGFDLSKRQ